MMLTRRRTITVWNDVSVDAPRLPRGLMSVEDAAAWIGVSDETLRRYIEDGTFQGASKERNTWGREGWRWVVDTSQLMAFKKVRDTNVGPGGRLPKGYSD